MLPSSFLLSSQNNTAVIELVYNPFALIFMGCKKNLIKEASKGHFKYTLMLASYCPMSDGDAKIWCCFKIRIGIPSYVLNSTFLLAENMWFSQRIFIFLGNLCELNFFLLLTGYILYDNRAAFSILKKWSKSTYYLRPLRKSIGLKSSLTFDISILFWLYTFGCQFPDTILNTDFINNNSKY